jgi:competence ComEA-like helix-hairpin-helix protein
MRSASALVIVFVSAAVAASPVFGQQPSVDSSRANFERLCGTCHEPERSTSSRRTRDQWLQTVNSMVARGAEGTDAELMDVVEYLTREHGRVNMNLATAPEIAAVLGLTATESGAIVQYRRERGSFEDAAGVGRVPGVDAKKLAVRRDAMVFGSRVASNAGRVPVAALTAANNWPSVNGGPQREGWARAEAMLSKSTVGAVQLLYTHKLDNQNRGTNALTPPLVLGNLISYRGFKEMLFLGGSSESVYSIDAVLNRVIWTTRLPVPPSGVVAGSPDTCPGGLMGIVMNGTAASGFAGAAPGIRRPGVSPFGTPATGGAKSGLVMGLAGGFGRNGLVLAVGGDGRVYPLYQSNGAVFETPIPFLPPNSNVRSLNLFDNTLYATNLPGCGGDAVYALDLASEDKSVAKFDAGARPQGSAGPAIGTDGTVYVHAGGRIVALTAKSLKEKDHFAISNPAATGMTPLVFQHNGRDLIVAGSGSEVYLLDSAALGGNDHRTPLANARVDGTLRGALASWEDPETGARWIYAPVWSPSESAGGGIAAFTLEQREGRSVITPRWAARDIVAPAAPAIANGLVFVLSTGNAKNRASLHILDAASGKPLFTSRDAVAGAANPETGLAIANGRVYFSTIDNTVYCFGIPTEH